MMKKGAFPLLISVVCLVFVSPSVLWADDTARFTRGFLRTVTGSLQIPYHIVDSTWNRPIPFGPVEGALKGTFYAMSNIVGGLFEMGTTLLPYAKYAVFFL